MAKQDRRRKKNPRRHQYCLRLNDRQKELLQIYAAVKELSEVDAIRLMIDGLEGWLKRQEARIAGRQQLSDGTDAAPGPGASVMPRRPAPPAPDPGEGHSGLDSAETDVDASVGDFAGRPSVALPKPRFDED